jgi:hypothetical protein
MVERKKNLRFLLSNFCEFERIKKAVPVMPFYLGFWLLSDAAPEAHYRFIRSIKQYDTN